VEVGEVNMLCGDKLKISAKIKNGVIEDIKFDMASRQLEFMTKRLAQMAFLQSRCTDYPYKRWKLRCVENQVAVLDIETKRGLLLSFEIGPGYLMLQVEKEEG
jgi:hypothetical protein